MTIRSTFIVGFTGETEAEFQELLDFLSAVEIDRVGCFKYSPVMGAKANDLPDQIAPEVLNDRCDRFMKLQQKISAKRLKRKVGRIETILIDEVDGANATGRSAADAPEIDGKVFVKGITSPVRPRQFVQVKIEKAGKYDLHGIPAVKNYRHCAKTIAPRGRCFALKSVALTTAATNS